MMACSSPLLLLLVVLTLFTGCSNVHGIRETYFIAADLGTDAMKAVAFRRETTVDGAATSTGGGVAVSLDLVLNDQANRRSPPCVALRYFPHYNSTTGETQLVQERALAEQAHALSIRFPTQVVCAPTTLLGRESDAPDVAPRRAGNRVVAASPQRKTAAVFVPTKASGGEDASGSIFTAEELTGMLLGYLKRMAEKADRDYNDLSAAEIEQLVGTTPHAAAIDEPWTADFGLKGGIARYATIVMPAHSSVAARQAMVDAGAAAGLRVVHVCHPTTAAAVQLAHMKAQQLFASTDKPVTLMIFDMGRHKTEAAVFQLAPINAAAIAAQTKTKHLAGLEGSIVLKGLATNPHLGGEDFDRCIAEVWDRESLGSRFFGTTTDSQETLEHVKQRQSLLRAANRAREMLSANREIPVTVEGVSVEGTSGPFTTHLTREQLVTACAPLFDAAVAVRDAAIESTSGLIEAASQLDRLEVIGGATRMPELQRRLARGYNPRGAVDRTLNGDEAAVMGAAFLGAVALKQSRRQFTVLEWLTNSISFAVSPPLQASDAAVPAYELHDLFHARKSLLPDVQSVVLHDRHDNFVFSFFSLPASATAQDGCFAQHSSIEGVVAAREKAKSVEGDEKVSSLITQRLDLVDTEVVVEAIASDSGIPYINKVYLRATYNKTTTTFTRQVSSLEKQKTVETEEAASSSSTTDGIKEGDIEASGDDSAANTAEEAAQAPLEETLVMSTMESTTVIRAFALTARLTHDTTIPGPCSSTAATREELTLYKSQLLAMQRSDDMRTYKGALRNDIESMLMHLKATHAWEDDTTPEGLPPSWKEEVRQISDWLDDEAEVADHNQLMAQKKELLRLGKEIEQLAGQ